MHKLLIFLALGIFLTQGIIAVASEEDTNTFSHQISITENNNFLSVIEQLTIQGDSNESYDEITVWIQNGANNVEIMINSNPPDSIDQNGSEYICDITSFGIIKEESTDLYVSYRLEKDTVFSKKFVRTTNSISVKFKGEDIFTGTNLAIGSIINLKLYESIEPTLDWFIAILIILLLILIAVLVVYIIRKRKTVKIKESTSDSEELLNTKKTLLMSLLKDIEKQHRANQISDETYHKLKERYKQEAVEAMKKLEDMK
ncbi:hypothetical protein AYK24_01770 [Thermoplasmatales archaeon SG8-52-4]|nr:MAG: hypothetical protein AYK24_01770 [Thermoplasmatales archaeon SG8-52-4]